MKWLIVAPFIHSSDNRWLGAFVPEGRHQFSTVPSESSVSGGRTTSLAGWLGHVRQSWNALRLAKRQENAGLITVFPQLPVAAGLLSNLFRPRVPIIAWTFNIGRLPGRAKQILSGLALRRVDAVIVHSRAEVEEYAAYFRLPPDKVFFVPLQRVIPTTSVDEETERPYAISLGSANRDYALLFKVLAARPVRTIVVASKAAVSGLDIPECVEVLSGLSLEKCHDLLQGARVSIIPVANPTTASGQVTLLNSMGLGRATIITRCPGSVDYVVDGKTAVLVSPGSHEEMAAALDRLWTDGDFRTRLGQQGRSHVVDHYSDAAIGRIMGGICDLVEERLRRKPADARG